MRSKKATKLKKRMRRNTRKRIGGEAIAHGGFGCVFYEGLKCKDGLVTDNTITKLLTARHATQEFNNITKFERLLKDIPDYTHYFLLYGFSLCEPGELTSQDRIGFDSHCTYLGRYNITAKNVNESLPKLRIIRMPYGGLDVYSYIYNIGLEYEKMVLLNTTLLSLFTNGIIQMNNRDVYHCDIKGSNVLVDDMDTGKLYTRLIDWGISIHLTSEKIPAILKNRSIQYNVPFSSILFTDDFVKMYTASRGTEDLEPFVHTYVLYWMTSRGVGHIATINRLFKQIHVNPVSDLMQLETKMMNFSEDVLQYKYAYYYIFKYITEILRKYTVDGKLDMQRYFVNVFLKNVDVWGFVMIYSDLLKYYTESVDKLYYDKKITNTIKQLIMLLVENGAELIDHEKMRQLIMKLNILFTNASKIRRGVSQNSTRRRLPYTPKLPPTPI